MNILNILERKSYLEAFSPMTENQKQEYLCLLDELNKFRENITDTKHKTYESEFTIVMSDVEGREVRNCKYCGKQEFLFTGVDENSMAKYGCCRECYYLFVE